MKKRYRWEIKRGSSGVITCRALGHDGSSYDSIFLGSLQRYVNTLRRPYRVSYTTDNLCRAKMHPRRYGRRAWRVKP